MSAFLGAVLGFTLAAIAATALYGATNSATKEPAHTHFGLDSLTSNPYEGAVGELTLNNGSGITSCTVSMVGPTGQVLTAVHCFQEPAICDFDPVVGEYPLSSAEILVDVASVNGTAEKWTFTGYVLGWSGLLDVMLIQLYPKVKVDGAVITLVSQPYLHWGTNRQLERAEPVRALSFDQALLKKLGHAGAVMHPYADRGSGFAVSIEQVFAHLATEEGASGSAVVNAAGQIVMAPLTYGWSNAAGNIYAASGTSSDVSGALVRAILAGTPPNGPAHRKYLVPTLGIVPQFVLSGINVQTYMGNEYIGMFENKGIVFYWLAVPLYYEFLTQGLASCGFPPYNMTAPSIEGAPLVETFYGQPPPFFEDFPAYDSNTYVALMAMQRAGQWVYLGEDAGLETISGVLATGGYWPGDSVLVRIKSGNPFLTTTEEANWEASYNVTLQPVDPFWDTIQSGPFVNYASFIRVNQTQGGGVGVGGGHTLMHYDSSFKARSSLLVSGRASGKRGVGGITEAPQGVDISVLPTLTDLYLKHRGMKRRKPVLFH
jgi:hypothetical protein